MQKQTDGGTMLSSERQTKPASLYNKKGKARLPALTIGLTAAGLLLSSSDLHITPKESPEQARAHQEASRQANDAINEYLASHGTGSFSDTYPRANRVCAILGSSPEVTQILGSPTICEVRAGVATIQGIDGISMLQAGHSDTTLEALKFLPDIICGDQSCTDMSQPESVTVYRGEGAEDGVSRITVYSLGESYSSQQDMAARLNSVSARLGQNLG